MLLSKDDFKIKKENFDLAGDRNLVRIACGLFFLPHVAGKFESLGHLNPGVVKFFGAVGFSLRRPGCTWRQSQNLFWRLH